jgi:type IV pilus assembly protein PilV
MIDVNWERIQTKINDHGFSLIEVLLAMVLFSVGMMAIASLLTRSGGGINSGRRVTEASALAADLMERLMVLPYDTADLDDVDGDGTSQDLDGDLVDDDGGNFGLEDATAATADHQEPSGIYTVFWNVAVNHPDTNMKTIRIIVIWQAAFESVHGQRSASFDFIRIDI